jgi:hypothetical protein
MAGPGILTQGNLAPLRQYAEAEVINFFSLNVTGQNGMFVSYVTGNQNPDNANGYSNLPVGAAYTNIISTRYLNTRQVRPATFGDTKWQVAGVTLHTTAEYDENGNKLILQPSDAVYERGYVLSGQSTPILKRGLVTLVMSQVDGVPLPGYVGAVTGNGRITVLNPTAFNVTGVGNIANSIVGRFISSTGNNNYASAGGFVQFEVNV